MKSLLLCALVLLATTLAIHNVACQEEATPTTTLAPQVADEKDGKEVTTTEVPPTTTTSDNSTAGEVKAEETKPDETTKPKEGEEEKKEGDDVAKEPKEGGEDEEEEKQPKEPEDGEMEQGVPPPQGQQQPKIIFVQQHIRDPNTGVVYTRQVPLIPSNYLRPLPLQPRGAPQERPNDQGPQPYDPLGQFSAAQKKRQFFQDMLLTQLGKFEREIEPMVDREGNATEKNDIEELLGSVGELKRTLEGHQIFNISDIMHAWKQGKLDSGSGEGETMDQRRPPPMLQGPPQMGGGFQAQLPPQFQVVPQGAFNPQQQQRPRPNPPLQLRTLILVPQIQQQQPQQQQQQIPQHYQPFPGMNFRGGPQQQQQQQQTIPVIHITRRAPSHQYQPVHQEQPQGLQGDEQLEPQAQPSEEYANGNEIFGY